MDAVKFIEERDRMCKSHKSCIDCSGYDRGFCRFGVSIAGDKADSQIKIVEEWSAAHPQKTRQSVFLEQYPEASISEHGVLLVCPCPISASHRNAHGGCATIGRRCDDCRKEFWSQEVE